MSCALQGDNAIQPLGLVATFLVQVVYDVSSSTESVFLRELRRGRFVVLSAVDGEPSPV